MMYSAGVLLKYLSLSTVEKLVVIASRIVYGDLSRYGLPWPREGPFTMKIKSGEIQVLPAEIESIRGNEVLFRDGFKRSTQKWLKEADDLLNEDGFAKQSFPNHWKGKNGLYCVGLARRGFYGANLEAQNIANDIASLMTQG
ncbi:hypothetical protein SESBI_35543 [Sesbania bispinosa]|nr:hypothetical protein SESBI_35543 [Sesbania bispinosa]